MTHLYEGDWGESSTYHRPVADVVKAAAPITLEMSFLALFIAYPLGIILGIISAVRQDRMFDHISRFFAIAFVSFEDELVQRYASRWILRVIKALGPARSPLRRIVDRRLFRKIQARAERISLRQRRGVLRADDWLEEFLGFAGRDV